MREIIIEVFACFGVACAVTGLVLLAIWVVDNIREHFDKIREREFITKQACQDIERLKEKVRELEIREAEGRLIKYEDETVGQ